MSNAFQSDQLNRQRATKLNGILFTHYMLKFQLFLIMFLNHRLVFDENEMYAATGKLQPK